MGHHPRWESRPRSASAKAWNQDPDPQAHGSKRTDRKRDLAIERELRGVNVTVVLAEFTPEYLAAMAARASNVVAFFSLVMSVFLRKFYVFLRVAIDMRIFTC